METHTSTNDTHTIQTLVQTDTSTNITILSSLDELTRVGCFYLNKTSIALDLWTGKFWILEALRWHLILFH